MKTHQRSRGFKGIGCRHVSSSSLPARFHFTTRSRSNPVPKVAENMNLKALFAPTVRGAVSVTRTTMSSGCPSTTTSSASMGLLLVTRYVSPPNHVTTHGGPSKIVDWMRAMVSAAATERPSDIAASLWATSAFSWAFNASLRANHAMTEAAMPAAAATKEIHRAAASMPRTLYGVTR